MISPTGAIDGSRVFNATPHTVTNTATDINRITRREAFHPLRDRNRGNNCATSQASCAKIAAAATPTRRVTARTGNASSEFIRPHVARADLKKSWKSHKEIMKGRFAFRVKRFGG
jgi:hypothetical protein